LSNDGSVLRHTKSLKSRALKKDINSRDVTKSLYYAERAAAVGTYKRNSPWFQALEEVWLVVHRFVQKP
jgi:hypothetical protein